jgi:hypothetical protein
LLIILFAPQISEIFVEGTLSQAFVQSLNACKGISHPTPMQIRNHNPELNLNNSYPVENSGEGPARRQALEATPDALSPKILDVSSIISEKPSLPRVTIRGR